MERWVNKTERLKAKCAAAGISVQTYYNRIRKGMTPEEALKPKEKTVAERCREAGIEECVYYKRKASGWPEDKLFAPLRKWTRRGNYEVSISPAPMVSVCGDAGFVFEKDFQKKRRQYGKKASETMKKVWAEKQRKEAMPAAKPLVKPRQSYLEEMRDKYGRQKIGISKASACPPSDAGWVLDGWRATILKDPKKNEWKYQLVSTHSQQKTLTNEVRDFVEAVVRVCDPQGRLGIRIVER